MDCILAIIHLMTQPNVYLNYHLPTWPCIQTSREVSCLSLFVYPYILYDQNVEIKQIQNLPKEKDNYIKEV